MGLKKRVWWNYEAIDPGLVIEYQRHKKNSGQNVFTLCPDDLGKYCVKLAANRATLLPAQTADNIWNRRTIRLDNRSSFSVRVLFELDNARTVLLKLAGKRATINP